MVHLLLVVLVGEALSRVMTTRGIGCPPRSTGARISNEEGAINGYRSRREAAKTLDCNTFLVGK